MAYVRAKKSGNNTYYYLVDSKKIDGQARQRVLVYLGDVSDPEEALEVWPGRIEDLRERGRDSKADRLEANLQKLRGLYPADVA